MFSKRFQKERSADLLQDAQGNVSNENKSKGNHSRGFALFFSLIAVFGSLKIRKIVNSVGIGINFSNFKKIF